MSDDAVSPIFCRPTVLTPDERELSKALRSELASATREVIELADGYAFLYPPRAALFQKAAEWISLERRCCPFLTFELAWGSGDDTPSRLSVTGPIGAKEFMAAEIPALPKGSLVR